VLIVNLATSTKAIRKIVVTVLLLGISGYAAFAVFSRIDPGKYHAKLTQIEEMAEGKSTTGSAAVRLRYYQQTLAAIPKHPVLGGGVGSWSVFYFGTDQRMYPHNLFLLVGFEEGLVGITALCVFLAAIGAASVRLVRKTGTRYAAFPSLVLFCFVVSMFSGDLDDNRILWYWTGVTLAVCAITASRYQDSFVTRFVFRHRAYSATAPLGAMDIHNRYPSAG
jgi:O-antigen ligase